MHAYPGIVRSPAEQLGHTLSAAAKQACRAALVVRMKADAQQAIRSTLTACAMPSLARCARFGSLGASHPCDHSILQELSKVNEQHLHAIVVTLLPKSEGRDLLR